MLDIKIVKLAISALLALMPFGAALSQEAYPSRPIRLIVPYPPGGIGDTFARTLTPRAIVTALHDALAKVVAAPEIVERLGALAFEIIAADPERSTALVREETELFGKVVRSSGAKAE